MLDALIDSIKFQYQAKSTPELLRIWSEKDGANTNYMEEAFEAVRQILTERGALRDGFYHRTESDSPKNKGSPDSFTFECLVCRTKLRIKIPPNSGRYYCPNCSAEYDPIVACRAPYVFILVPNLTDNSSNGNNSGSRRKNVPPEIERALKVFNLQNTANYEDIKKAYRNMVQQYHPDRVSHLGLELRNLAEEKTKELVAAYGILKAYFQVAAT